MGRCYLEPTETRKDKGLDVVRLWLSGFITAEDFFTNPPPRTHDLHSALMCAVMELKIHLDPQLEHVVNTALEAPYRMQFDPELFWTTRRFDVEMFEALRESGIRALARSDVKEYLEEARREIAWMKNEIRRLEVHCHVAVKLLGAKVRSGFSYWPTERVVVGRFAAMMPVVRRREEAVVARRGDEDEDEDEEMLDEDEHEDADAERRARSPTPGPGEMSGYDDDDDDDELSEERQVGEDDDAAAVSDEDDVDKENTEGQVKQVSVGAASWGSLRL